MIVIDKQTGDALLPNGTRIRPRTSLKEWFENGLAEACVYWVNDQIGSAKRTKGGGPQRFAYDQLTDPLNWHWVWFSTADFVRDGYRLRVIPFYEGGALHAIGIDAPQEARALLEAPKAWPEYSAEDEHDQWDVLRRDLGAPNGYSIYLHQQGKDATRKMPGYSFAWGNATVRRNPHESATSIRLQYAPMIKKLIRQQ